MSFQKSNKKGNYLYPYSHNYRDSTSITFLLKEIDRLLTFSIIFAFILCALGYL